VSVAPVPVDADISAFSASPNAIATGDTSTLTWTVASGADCSINRGIGAVANTGSQVVNPVATTAYTLACDGINGGASDTAIATVSVNPPPVTDSDGDGIDDEVEDAGPNNGDANYDGIPDSEQSNVATLINPQTHKYSTIVVTDDCNVISEAVSEGLAGDVIGGWSFSLTCTQPGGAADVAVYLDGDYDTDGLRAFKYNSAFDESIDITDRTSLDRVNLGGASVAVASYRLVDGGDLDEDGLVDGRIVDPLVIRLASTSSTDDPVVGPTEPGSPVVPLVPNTSFSSISRAAFAHAVIAEVVIVVAVMIFAYRVLSRHYKGY